MLYFGWKVGVDWVVVIDERVGMVGFFDIIYGDFYVCNLLYLCFLLYVEFGCFGCWFVCF